MVELDLAEPVDLIVTYRCPFDNTALETVFLDKTDPAADAIATRLLSEASGRERFLCLTCLHGYARSSLNMIVSTNP